MPIDDPGSNPLYQIATLYKGNTPQSNPYAICSYVVY
jgi:hypothetical protein